MCTTWPVNGSEVMGVKELWSVLSPTRQECSFAELRNKILAVDLSGWICQAQAAKV